MEPSVYWKQHRSPTFSVNIFEQIKRHRPNTFLVLTRSKNLNVVVYELNIINGKIAKSNPILVYWLNIDPQYRSKYDYEELTYMEKNYVYGVDFKHINTCAVKVSFRLKKFSLTVFNSSKRICAKYNNLEVKRVHVKLNSILNPWSLYQLVKSIEIYSFGKSKPICMSL